MIKFLCNVEVNMPGFRPHPSQAPSKDRSIAYPRTEYFTGNVVILYEKTNLRATR